jgi:hypothetical protein
MKITASIPEEIVSETKKYSGSNNITQALLIALQDYINHQRLKRSMNKVKRKPLEFGKNFSAVGIRKLNREWL